MVEQAALTRLMKGAFIEYQETGGRSVPPSVAPNDPVAVFLEIPATLPCIHLLSCCACALVETIPNLAEPGVNLYNLELAIQEVAVNIVHHAYAEGEGRIQMWLQLVEQPPQLTLTFHDTGVSFDPTSLPAPQLGELQEHGLGLFLVCELMDEVEYEAGVTGNRWKLVKRFPVEE